MAKTTEVTSKNFEEEVLQSKIPVLVDFWAPWCQPCLMMAPILDELVGEMAGKIKIAKLNTEDFHNQQLAIKYQVQSIPNMKVFKQGKVIEELIGSRSKEDLKKELEELIQ